MQEQLFTIVNSLANIVWSFFSEIFQHPIVSLVLFVASCGCGSLRVAKDYERLVRTYERVHVERILCDSRYHRIGRIIWRFYACYPLILIILVISLLCWLGSVVAN